MYIAEIAEDADEGRIASPQQYATHVPGGRIAYTVLSSARIATDPNRLRSPILCCIRRRSLRQTLRMLLITG